MHALSTSENHPLTVKVNINNVNLQMEVDTGATLSIISEKTYKRLWPIKRLTPLLKYSDITWKMYAGEQIEVLGSIDINATYLNQKKQLLFLVVSGDDPLIYC